MLRRTTTGTMGLPRAIRVTASFCCLLQPILRSWHHVSAKASRCQAN